MISITSDDKDLQKAFSRLNKAARSRVIRNALMTSVRPVARKAKELAKQRTTKRSGKLLKGIQAKWDRKQSLGLRQVVSVGYFQDAYYGQILEFGSENRMTRKGAGRGRVKPLRMITDATFMEKDDQHRRFRREVVRFIQREADK